MPTPVATAKQCLTPEASNVLDEAVSVARCRSHAQTTSLHAVSAFLSLPSSPLREACFRSRNASFCFYSSSPRAQIRALDFALSISLDRSPAASSQRVCEPPVSNALMAAIKRSQANQRRQPDSFGYKQDIGKEQLGTSGIKVEILNLIVAVLDDPMVSRLFNEAGYSSFDLKLAIVKPLQGFWRELRPFRLPSYGGDDDFRRIGEVLVRKQGRNPLLFGICGYEVLQRFVEAVRTQDQLLPLEIRGMTVFSVEHEILKFVSDDFGAELMKSRIEELAVMVENCCGPGLIVCFGDLNVLVMEESDLRDDLLSCLIAKFTSFLELYKERVWLIGCGTYEVYLKFLNKFPSVEKNWNLQPLAILSMKTSKGNMSFKSSLMRSFVPFAGLFPPSSDFGCVSKSSFLLTQKAISASRYNSVADRCQITLPSWLRMDKISTSDGSSDTSKIACVESKSNTEQEKVGNHSQANDCQTLSTSTTSVATDLVLGSSSSYSHPDFKSLYKALITKIHGQEEAIRMISRTISQTSTRVKGATNRKDVWMSFTGSNIVSRKTAIALAEVICGDKDELIHVDLTSQDDLVDQCTVIGTRISYSNEQIRERTTIEQIAYRLSKMASSVVLLENFHLAYPPARESLLHGIRTGKFFVSNGREVCVGNAIFLLASEAGSEGSRCTHDLKPWPMQIVVNAPSSLLNKRKLNSTDQPAKRLHLGSGTRLDLNLPADENNEIRPLTWVEELLSQVNTTVNFKPFDYDALIQGCFSKFYCSGCALEIEPRAMDQLLAAKETEVEDWIENVLSEWFVEAKKRYHNVFSHSLVELNTIRPLYGEEEEEDGEGGCEWLPSKVLFHCRQLESL